MRTSCCLNCCRKQLSNFHSSVFSPSWIPTEIFLWKLFTANFFLINLTIMLLAKGNCYIYKSWFLPMIVFPRRCELIRVFDISGNFLSNRSGDISLIYAPLIQYFDFKNIFANFEFFYWIWILFVHLFYGYWILFSDFLRRELWGYRRLTYTLRYLSDCFPKKWPGRSNSLSWLWYLCC